MVGRPRDVDIVLHGDGYAVAAAATPHPSHQRFGIRQRVFLVAQADEDGGIVVIADALIAARDGLLPASWCRRDARRQSRQRFQSRNAPRVGWLKPVRADRAPARKSVRIEQAMCHCIHYPGSCRYTNSDGISDI